MFRCELELLIPSWIVAMSCESP